MARGLAFLFAAGASLVAVTLALLPAPAEADTLGLWLAVAVAYATALLLAAARERIALGALQLFVGGGTLLITGCVVYGGEASTAYALMYVWVALYSHYFFRPAVAVAETVFAGVAYGVALVLADAAPDPEAAWVMAAGTLVVAGALIGSLTEAARVQTADLAALAEIGAVQDVTEFAHAVCDGLRRSASADVVVLLEPLSGGDGLRVTGMAGSAEAGLAFNAVAALQRIQRAYRDAECQHIPATDRRGLLDGAHAGLAQPVLRDGAAIGVLALAWQRPRHRISNRVGTAAVLYAAEASLAIERQELRNRERERRALEINDNIVQGLVVAKYAVTSGQIDQAVQAIDETLDRARGLITRQLDDVGERGQIRPGDLVRDEASGS